MTQLDRKEELVSVAAIVAAAVADRLVLSDFVVQKAARCLQADSSGRSWGPALVLVAEAGKPRVEHWPAGQDRFVRLAVR
jgi:hypothetical protein